MTTQAMRGAWSRLLLAASLLVAGAGCAYAQRALPPIATASAAPAAPRASDPLGRDTPRKAILGFSRAAHRGDFALAERYVQLTRRQQPQAEGLINGLDDLMDRYFLRPVSEISDVPEGSLDDGLAPDRERAGALRIGDQTLFIDMVRVEDGGMPVWLVASDTMQGVPRFRALLRPLWLDRVLPPLLEKWTVFGLSAVHLFVWVASILLPLLVLHLLLRAVRACLVAIPGGIAYSAVLVAWLAKVHWPLVVIGTLCTHLAVASFGPSLTFRVFYRRIVIILLIVALAWGLQRLLGLLFTRARLRLHGDRRTGARSLLLLGERLLNVVVVVASVLSVLAIVGLDIRTTLAGLGIVGFAVALGARKTVENILGGVMLLGDQAIAVGDECKVSGRQGRVEDITLRSVRIRTREQTLLSIPAGVLASEDIENFASRGKVLATNMLRLSHRTSASQIRSVRDGIDALLRAEPLVEQATASIRVVGLGAQGIEIELFAYFLTTEWSRFLAAREELLLQIVGVVEAAGASLAAPYVAADTPVVAVAPLAPRAS